MVQCVLVSYQMKQGAGIVASVKKSHVQNSLEWLEEARTYRSVKISNRVLDFI